MSETKPKPEAEVFTDRRKFLTEALSDGDGRKRFSAVVCDSSTIFYGLASTELRFRTALDDLIINVTKLDRSAMEAVMREEFNSGANDE